MYVPHDEITVTSALTTMVAVLCVLLPVRQSIKRKIIRTKTILGKKNTKIARSRTRLILKIHELYKTNVTTIKPNESSKVKTIR